MPTLSNMKKSLFRIGSEDLVASPAVQDSETAQGGEKECKIGGHFPGRHQFSRNCLGMQNLITFSG